MVVDTDNVDAEGNESIWYMGKVYFTRKYKFIVLGLGLETCEKSCQTKNFLKPNSLLNLQNANDVIFCTWLTTVK